MNELLLVRIGNFFFFFNIAVASFPIECITLPTDPIFQFYPCVRLIE